uniref:Uncharacterized protein n=1 Tax=Aplanochytrium stocchinoi TaxID=215587 RepID=A0A7S3PNN3_9STRA
MRAFFFHLYKMIGHIVCAAGSFLSMSLVRILKMTWIVAPAAYQKGPETTNPILIGHIRRLKNCGPGTLRNKDGRCYTCFRLSTSSIEVFGVILGSHKLCIQLNQQDHE